MFNKTYHILLNRLYIIVELSKWVITKDVKKIRTRGYPWIKPAIGKKLIL